MDGSWRRGHVDNTIIVWDAETGEPVRTLTGHSADVVSVAWRPDGRQLASGSQDNTIIVWDAETWEPVRTLTGHSADVRSVAWRPDGRQLASGSSDNTIIVWDAETWEPVRTLTGHSDAVSSVAWRPDGRQLASGSSGQHDHRLGCRDRGAGAHADGAQRWCHRVWRGARMDGSWRRGQRTTRSSSGMPRPGSRCAR